jgi:hypothetical protein
MIGSEGDPYNLLFFGVILVALAGAVIARFRAGGMAAAMAAAAIAHVAVAVGGMESDLRGGILSALLAGLWALSALAFAKAGGDGRTTGGGGASLKRRRGGL